MVQTVRQDKKGFTLVEVLVAMVIILVLLLGLVQAALLSIDSNLRNLLREEAVKIADQGMNGVLVDSNNTQWRGLRERAFDDLSASATWPNWACMAPVQRTFRNITRNYNVCWNIRNVSADVISLDVAVGWNHRNENPLQAPTNSEFQHIITSIMRRPL